MSDKNLKQGLQGKYFVKDNTFFDVAKTDPMDFVEKEIGDSKEPGKFLPQQKVKRWDNECNVSVRLVHDEKTPDVVVEGDDIVWKGKKIEARFYDVFNDEHPEGAGEFEITLKEKPDTNVVQFTVQDKDVEYSYQGELTPEEIERGSERPENVVGSYAVYAKTPKTNYVGQKEYKTGKVGHIYRPRIEDSNGDWTWGELLIENGILSVTIPQEFLDNAVYPVRHAAGLTFGYTTQGASDKQLSTSGDGNGAAQKGTSITGTLSSVSAYLKRNSSNANATLALFSNSGSVPSASLTGGNATILSASYVLKTVSLSYSMSGSTYWAVVDCGGEGPGTQKYVAYDSGSGSGAFKSDIGVWSTTTDRDSIYATYTADGGSATPTLMLMGCGV